LEEAMQLPLFIETSKGLVNLALVTHIYERGSERDAVTGERIERRNELVFQFERSMVAIPEKEGKALMAELRPVMRERFIEWQMGVLK
jgi:hypothetical protein